MERVYADHNATTPMAESVREAVRAALDAGFGNPSSVHEEGRLARDQVEIARRRVADMFAADPHAVTLTGGGTEADALGLCGLATAARRLGREPLVAAPRTEHPAVAGAVHRLMELGFRFRELAVDASGLVELADVERAVADGAAAVALALANHELGTVNPVAAAAGICREHGAFLHCDAVQGAGKLSLDVAALEADAVAISAHKFYGPKGAGALWVRPGIDLEPLLPGGHQERELRPGTENVLGIVGMGAAAVEAVAALGRAEQIGALRDRFEAGLAGIPGAMVHGPAAQRVCNTSNVRFAGAAGEVVVAGLDLAGVAVSTGAACTSGSVEPSPVLLAVGLEPAEAAEAVRFSFGVGTTEAEVDYILERLPDIVERARQFG